MSSSAYLLSTIIHEVSRFKRHFFEKNTISCKNDLDWPLIWSGTHVVRCHEALFDHNDHILWYVIFYFFSLVSSTKNFFFLLYHQQNFFFSCIINKIFFSLVSSTNFFFFQQQKKIFFFQQQELQSHTYNLKCTTRTGESPACSIAPCVTQTEA